MTLANYINDLLYRYDCVIVPNFGGFIANKTTAYIGENRMYPPFKKITFNSRLQHNDGLLANYIVAKDKLSFDEAVIKIEVEVEKWKTTLKNQSLHLLSIGVLALNEEGRLEFEPNTHTNFLISSFGLTEITASVLKTPEEDVKPVIERDHSVVNNTAESNKTSKLVRYAAVASILLTIGTVGVINLNKSNADSVLPTLANKQDKLEQKIQQATFVIDKPLPTIELKGNRITKQNYPYHVIAGAFRQKENAQKKVRQLQEKGYQPVILSKNKWGLIQVTYGSFLEESQARSVLSKIKEHESKDAWLLIKRQ